jgi:hypothetical protein
MKEKDRIRHELEKNSDFGFYEKKLELGYGKKGGTVDG